MTPLDRVKPDDTAASVGWIYEIDPFAADRQRRAVRRTAMGRFSHESAAVLGDTVYLTEDSYQGHFWKFVPERAGDLSAGKLYAYRAGDRSWLPVEDVYNARPEATAAGATPYNRLEDLKIGPDGQIYLAETGAHWAGDKFGRVRRFDPVSNTMEIWLEGDGKVMAQPDNLLFDRQGRLLVAEDQYGMNVTAYGPNELLRVSPDKRAESLLAVRRDGEPSGPSWGPGGVLFLSVMAAQHSGLLAIRGL
jgi:secreted PhoX family phosphatase